MAHKAHVDHLPATATQMQVSGLFTGCGRVLNVYVRKKGDEAWAFVNFATGKALDAALALDGMQFEGRTLAVTRSASLNPGPADGGGGAAAKKPAAAAASPPDKPPYPVVADTAASEPVTASTILTGTNVKMPSGGKGRGRGPEQRPGYRQPDFRPHTRWWERGQDHDARWKEHLRRRAEQRDELEGNIAEVPTQCWDGEYAHVVVEGTTCYRMFAAHGGEAISKRFDEEEGLYDLDDEVLLRERSGRLPPRQEPPLPSPQPLQTQRGHSCHGARGVRTLGVSGDPPGDNCNHPEASRKEQKLPRSLWDLLATIKKIKEDRSCCLGGCIAGSCTGV